MHPCNCIQYSQCLKHLDLANMIVSTQNMRDLSNAIIHSTCLESLSICGCGPMSDEGMYCICDTVNYTGSLKVLTIKQLIVREDKVEQEQVCSDAFSYILNLQMFADPKSRIKTGKFLMYLSDAIKHTKSLTHLHVEGTAITDDAKQHLLEALPSSPSLVYGHVNGVTYERTV